MAASGPHLLWVRSAVERTASRPSRTSVRHWGVDRSPSSTRRTSGAASSRACSSSTTAISRSRSRSPGPTAPRARSTHGRASGPAPTFASTENRRRRITRSGCEPQTSCGASRAVHLPIRADADAMNSRRASRSGPLDRKGPRIPCGAWLVSGPCSLRRTFCSYSVMTPAAGCLLAATSSESCWRARTSSNSL